MKPFNVQKKKALFKDEVSAGLEYHKLGNDNAKYRSRFYGMARDEARHAKYIKAIKPK